MKKKSRTIYSWVAASKNSPSYRYIATRKRLHNHLEIPGCKMADGPDQVQAHSGERCKIYEIATNRDIDGNELIPWYRERCGKSEEGNAIMNEDLAGGKLLPHPGILEKMPHDGAS